MLLLVCELLSEKYVKPRDLLQLCYRYNNVKVNILFDNVLFSVLKFLFHKLGPLELILSSCQLDTRGTTQTVVVVNFFRIFFLLTFLCVEICDLVHDVEAILGLC